MQRVRVSSSSTYDIKSDVVWWRPSISFTKVKIQFIARYVDIAPNFDVFWLLNSLVREKHRAVCCIASCVDTFLLFLKCNIRRDGLYIKKFWAALDNVGHVSVVVTRVASREGVEAVVRAGTRRHVEKLLPPHWLVQIFDAVGDFATLIFVKNSYTLHRPFPCIFGSKTWQRKAMENKS